MDLEYGEASEAFRAEVVAFLAANWAPLDSPERHRPDIVSAFRAKAIQAGYLYRSVPRAYGGSGQDPDLIRAQVIREEFGRARAPLEIPGNGTTMVLPTLLAHGSDLQRKYFIPRTVSGEFTGRRGTRSRIPDRTWHRCGPGQSSTRMPGLSMARKSGRAWAITAPTCSCWPGRTGSAPAGWHLVLAAGTRSARRDC